MGIFDAVIQGVVQGLTEFLPVSSSGHLLLSQHILGVQENNLFFSVMLHLGTLFAVLAVYWKLIIKLIGAFLCLIKDIFTGQFIWTKLDGDKRMVIMLILALLPLFLLFIPIPGSGTNVYGAAEEFAEGSSIIVVGLSLLATSVLLYFGVKESKKSKYNRIRVREGVKELIPNTKQMGFFDAVWIGIMQFIAAIFPGLSRSGSTLSVGLLRGINKQTVLDFSFVLGTPAIVAAALLKFKEASESGVLTSVNIVPVIIGMVVSAVVGFLSIKLFKWLLKTDKMAFFIAYTFIAGMAVLVIGLMEKAKGVNIFTGLPL